MRKEEVLEKLLNYDWLVYEATGQSSCGMTRNDYEQLASIVESVKKEGMLIVEIGVCGGSSSALWASYAKETNGRFIAIDNYAKRPYWKPIFLKNMENLELMQYITFIQDDSIKIAEKFRLENHKKLDLIFIDGNHQYSEIKQDIENWYPLLKEDGIMCGHDCEFLCSDTDSITQLKSIPNFDKIDTHDKGHVGVVAAVSEFFKEPRIMGNRIWVSRKI